MIHHSQLLWGLASSLALGAVAVPSNARAADTVETWDVGATDVDFYVGYDGMGLRTDEQGFSGEIMLGYGLVERLSAYLGAALSSDVLFAEAASEVFLGVFGTPVDTDHFDLDLFLDLRAADIGENRLALAPAVELNFDLDPEMRSWGAYLTASFQVSRPQSGEGAAADVSGDVEATVGTYLTLGLRHQVLLVYDMTFHLRPGPGERSVDVGGVAVGYNAAISDALELIAEVRVDLPQGDEGLAAGLVVGFVATVPSVAEAGPPEAPDDGDES